MLHRDGELPTGFVIANDNDRRRAMTLAHQVIYFNLCVFFFKKKILNNIFFFSFFIKKKVRRFTNAHSLVTCHNAQSLPMLRDETGTPMLFDAVLADVPVRFHLI